MVVGGEQEEEWLAVREVGTRGGCETMELTGGRFS